MITIKDKQSIQKMKTAGVFLAEILNDIQPLIQVGTNTLYLDSWIEEQLLKKEMVSQSKGYCGYKHVSCISLNDVVVHGIPRLDIILKEGDLVKVDVCASWQGYCADMARCYFVGEGDSNAKKLVAVAHGALDKGIEMARSGNRLSDISAAIQQEVESHGYGVVRDFAGHGIGKSMHEAPEILNYGKAGKGPVLRPGMAFAIEPMITMGKFDVYVTHDGWTVKTKDKSLAAHVEDTIVITEQEPLVLTRKNQGVQ